MRIASRFFIAAILVAQLHTGASVVDSFDRSESGIAPRSDLQSAIVDAPGTPEAGKALALEWPATHKLWTECYYKTPIPIAELATQQSAAVRMQVWTPASPGITSFTIRLFDSQDEIFQWTAKLAPAQSEGWRTVTFVIDSATCTAHWGGRANGRLDYPLRLAGYSFVFANDKIPAGRILIRNTTALLVPKITLVTDRFPSLVNPSSGRCEINISNPEDHPVTATVMAKISDYAGKAVEVKNDATLAARGNASIPLPCGSERGIRWIAGTIKIGDEEFPYQNSIIVADPVERISQPGDFIFSICSHTEKASKGDQESEIKAAAAAGATEMRIADAWASVQPKPDVWRWETQDRLVELTSRYGIKPQITLGFTPSWAIPESLRLEQAEAYKQHKPDAWMISLFGPPEEAPWRAYVNAVATRYRGKINHYEIWNEPDLGFWRGTTDEYIQRLRWASEEIRRADPDAKVMTGGFATVLPHASRAKNPDLQERVVTEACDAFDIHAIHQHGPFSEFKGAVEGEFKRMRDRMPSQRPVYFNETALSSSFQGEKSQALAVIKKMSYVMSTGAIGYTWYDLRNDGISATDPEHNYGLLTQDFRPKASFAAYMEVVRQLQGMRPLGSYDLAPGSEAHAFGSTRGRVVVWWNENPIATASAVLFATGGAPVRVVDIMGQSHELEQIENVLMTQISQDPVYLQFAADGGKLEKPKMIGKLVDVEDCSSARIGQSSKCTVAVCNPFKHEMKMNLTWRDPAGRDASKLLVIPAGSTGRLPLDVRGPNVRSAIQGIDIRYAAEGLPWKGLLRYYVPVIHVIGSDPPNDNTPGWVLNLRDDMVNFTNADPALKNLNWRGPDDLSARVWAWRDGENLCIRANVRDDIHVQNETATNMWKGDSVQFAFGLPDDKEYWELGVARGDDGKIMRAAWTTPAGITGAENFFTADVQPIAGGLRYDITLPLAKFKLSDAALARGLRFNLIVNDNDGTLRKQIVRIAPGIGESKNPARFPVVQFAPAEKR